VSYATYSEGRVGRHRSALGRERHGRHPTPLTRNAPHPSS
jgi:hypothetical protein